MNMAMASSSHLSCSTTLLSLWALFALLTITAVSAHHIDYQPEDLLSDQGFLNLFEQWLTKHSKNYTLASERNARFQVFKKNLLYIHQHNHDKTKASSHRLGLTPFADLTLEEFKTQHLGFRNPKTAPAIREYSSSCEIQSLPTAVDWRQHGAVTPVKDQGKCGSCWAFSSVGAIEGAHALAMGELVSLSEQELVSCVHTNLGCYGGLMDHSFAWVIKNGGINTEEGYPYVSGMGRAKFCKWSKKKTKMVTLDGYEDVQPNSEDALRCAVAQQPVSVGINAGTRDFQLYAGGIFSSCLDARSAIDHAVLAVGYGSEDGKDYWIVKNSWSKEWGMEGYVHILRSTGNKRGVCGIHAFPSYPVVKTSPTSSIM